MDEHQVLTTEENLKMWYAIAVQALYELDRPMLLKMEIQKDIWDGNIGVYSSRTDDGGWLYKAIERDK